MYKVRIKTQNELGYLYVSRSSNWLEEMIKMTGKTYIIENKYKRNFSYIIKGYIFSEKWIEVLKVLE